MKTQNWNQSRSDFNHAWLKNRVLIALCKAQNVLAGKVEDSTIWEHLEDLLTEWRGRREDARRLISDFRRVANPSTALAGAAFSELDDDVKSWLADLTDRRWEAAEQPNAQIKLTLAAFEAFDQQADAFSSLLKQLRLPPDKPPLRLTERQLAGFLKSAHTLADAISELRPSLA